MGVQILLLLFLKKCIKVCMGGFRKHWPYTRKLMRKAWLQRRGMRLANIKDIKNLRICMHNNRYIIYQNSVAITYSLPNLNQELWIPYINSGNIIILKCKNKDIESTSLSDLLKTTQLVRDKSRIWIWIQNPMFVLLTTPCYH